MAQATSNDLVKTSIGSPMVSLREQSSSALMTAIHSPHDPGETLRRINTILDMPGYYVERGDEQTRALVLKEYCMALKDSPNWAVQRACDRWVKNGTRRPSPADLLIIIDRELRPLQDELARRQKEAARHAAELAEAEKKRVTPDATARLMAEAGFTPRRMDALRRAPMASTFAQAEDAQDTPRKPHWTEIAPPDGPDMKALQKARAENHNVIAARQAQAEAERQERRKSRIALEAQYQDDNL